MLAPFTATLIDGVIVPDAPLPLRDKSRLKIEVTLFSEAADPVVVWERFKASTEANGVHAQGDYVSREELYEGR